MKQESPSIKSMEILWNEGLHGVTWKSPLGQGIFCRPVDGRRPCPSGDFFVTPRRPNQATPNQTISVISLIPITTIGILLLILRSDSFLVRYIFGKKILSCFLRKKLNMNKETISVLWRYVLIQKDSDILVHSWYNTTTLSPTSPG